MNLNAEAWPTNDLNAHEPQCSFNNSTHDLVYQCAHLTIALMNLNAEAWPTNDLNAHLTIALMNLNAEAWPTNDLNAHEPQCSFNNSTREPQC
jgi:hypothetical protein